MSKFQLTAVRVHSSDRPLSKGQQTFNRLTQQIEKLRTQIAAWEETKTRCQKKYTEEMLPLLGVATGLKIKLLHALDRAATQKGLTRAERRILGEFIIGAAEDLLAERDDVEVKAVYNKYSASDYDSEELAHAQGMKDMIEDMFAMDLGDEAGVDSVEEVMRRAQACFEEQEAQFAAEEAEREARRAQRKKSARQLEKAAREEADAKQIQQSIRAIYRKLASALHPDREADPEERLRKTGLMQRINQAYDQQNLLQLLELQLELEHIDSHALSQIDEERLRHYNAILKKQVEDLRQEMMRIESFFLAQLRMAPYGALKPQTVMRALADDIVHARQINRLMEQDIRELAQPGSVKMWLKKVRG